MCGIAGYISRTEYNIQRMTDSLAHRGPDDAGLFSAFCGEKRIALGHRRLSILDISSAGHQPMTSNDSRCTIVYNGEIYNYQELRDKYLDRSVLTSRTDTEVLLSLLAQCGPSILSELNGDFAIALWDSAEETLTLARDSIGVKPLYYRILSDGIMFGSELKPFLESGLECKENVNDLPAYLVFKYYPAQRTPLEDVLRLEPGCFLQYQARQHAWTVSRYRQTLPKANSFEGNYADAIYEFRRVFHSSVEMRLLSDVPIGNFLSGGLDSSSIASIIRDRGDVIHHCARKNDEDLQAEGTSSDYYYAKKLSVDWGLNTKYYDIDTTNLTEQSLGQLMWYSDDLIADGSQIPSYLITSAARATSKVMLSGMGADELLLGYGGHILTRLSLILDKAPSVASRNVTALFRSLKPGQGMGKGYKRFLKKLGDYYSQPEYRYALYSIVGDYSRAANLLQDGVEPLDYIAPYFERNENPFAMLSRFEFENFLVKNLHYFDRMCMANGVEGRVPFLDTRLVDLVMSMPVKFRLSGRFVSKRLLKDSMRTSLPGYIRSRRKAGFGMPLRSILSNTEKAAKFLNYSWLDEHTRIPTERVKMLVSEHVQGLNDNSALLFAIISYRLWRENVLRA